MTKPRKPVALRGCVQKRRQGRSGVWGRNVQKDHHVKQGELSHDKTVFMRKPKSRWLSSQSVHTPKYFGNSMETG
jgi:hypothetical protein